MHEERIKKPLVEKDVMVQSMLALREELVRDGGTLAQEVVFKINSCLFSTYPHHAS